MTEKSSRWAITVYEPQFGCLEEMPPIVAEWGWQDETCPTTGKLHKQGYVRTHQQQRFAAMKKAFPGVHLEIARDWNKLLNYCKKTDTAVTGTQVHEKNDIPSLFTYSAELASRLAYGFETGVVNSFEIVMEYVSQDIMEKPGIEWIASNPQFITTWKKYWRQMLYRAVKKDRQTDAVRISQEDYNAPGQTPAEAEVQGCPEGDIRCSAQSGEYSSPQEASCDTTSS